MAPQTGRGAKDLASGAVLQMVEAATLGMPLEVWKTRMGRFRDEGTARSFVMVYKSAGGGLDGVRAYWKGVRVPLPIYLPFPLTDRGVQDICRSEGAGCARGVVARSLLPLYREVGNNRVGSDATVPS